MAKKITKEKQKKLLTEIMEADEKDGLYDQSAVDWLIDQIKKDQHQKALTSKEWSQVFLQAKQMEKEKSANPHIDLKKDEQNDPPPELMSATFSFSQEGNCVDGGFENLEIRCESSLGIDSDGGCFYILKTDQWAINSIDELKDLIDRIKLVVKK